jgi:hypothetical protein
MLLGLGVATAGRHTALPPACRKFKETTNLDLPTELDASARDLLMALNQSTAGDPEAQVSMYTLGETIGLDRDASAKAAEDLIALGIVEIRTLSGGIGLSEAGVAALTDNQGQAQTQRLGTDSPLDAARCEMVEGILTRLKSEMGRSGLDYECLAAMVADIRTTEAQLTSPRPKTAIVRECLASLRDAAAEKRQEEWRRLLGDFIG